jgi:queuine tRNA-ribosyltransferase
MGDVSESVSGIAVYSLDTMDDLPEPLAHLPRLDFTSPASPHEILQHIRRGMDIMPVPFIGAATDAGIALDFVFPPPKNDGLANGHSDSLAILGVDMWSPDHAVDVSPLSEACTCYACSNHHRAYVQHLLSAKEMLGWVLLQIHNHHVLDRFFAGIRESIRRNSFQEDIHAFEKLYQNHLPEKTGQGPR